MKKLFLLIFGVTILVGCSNSDENFEEWTSGYQRGYMDGYMKANNQHLLGEDPSLNFDWDVIYKENMIK